MKRDDLGFKNDQALLSHTQEQMQVKTVNVTPTSAVANLNIHKGKTKILKYNTEGTNSITHDGEALEEISLLKRGVTWRTTTTIIHKGTGICKQSFTQDTADPLDRYHQQQPTVTENKPPEQEIGKRGLR
ncbi:unnamed protein product [Schistosoma margrebowiei]|uniref:Uncharacterized protein n=1 Tax=Schistosoma margrebowiei TaxID=48269 RepID=A0A183LP44_9TREM|nr:unnamed protein product [Schistosoma margrebowiei]